MNPEWRCFSPLSGLWNVWPSFSRAFPGIIPFGALCLARLHQRHCSGDRGRNNNRYVHLESKVLLWNHPTPNSQQNFKFSYTNKPHRNRNLPLQATEKLNEANTKHFARTQFYSTWRRHLFVIPITDLFTPREILVVLGRCSGGRIIRFFALVTSCDVFFRVSFWSPAAC